MGLIGTRSRRIVRKIAFVAIWILAITMVLLLIWLRRALYHHFVLFPRQAAACAVIRSQRQPVLERTGWNEYRGVLHSHSHLSHDSEMSFEAILRALQIAERDFICLSDHCAKGRADFSAQWRGVHQGKLFIPGFEMKEGLMPFGVRSDAVLSNSTSAEVLAGQIVRGGGLLFYAHPEEPRAWDAPQLTGMEIYNVHADFKDEGGLLALLPDLLVNQRRYPEQVLRSIFDTPNANLRRWDSLNQSRHITGIAGNDCHQNTGFRLVYTASDTIKIEDTSPKKIAELKLNALTRPLAHAWFGPLTPDRVLAHVQLDPYERMVRYVSTHALARDLSEGSILDALKAGRVFVAFDLLADSTGFLWSALTPSTRAVMGEEIAWSPDLRLRAAAPHHCRFSVVRDGSVVHESEGFTCVWTPQKPGSYRVEAALQVGGEWTPWIYSNPIWVP